VATPTSGYRFLKWTGSVATIANPNAASTTITMSGNYSIRATFEETEATFHTLTVGVTSSGSTSPTVGQHTYAAGAVISISATPAGGYHFVNWIGNVGTVANVNAASTTITMNGNYSITANFQQAAATYYTLTMAATGGGSINPAVGQHSYAAGTVVPIIATAAGGYYFVNWTGNVGTIANVNAASTTIIMNGNYSITANFAVIPPGQYGLTISSGAGGSVTTPGEGTFIYGPGTVVNLVAAPAGGYGFVNWTGNVGTIANVTAASTTITMNGTYSITANFSNGGPPVPYNLTISSSAGGSVTTPGQGTFGYGSGMVVNLVATPASGYRFVNWTGNVGTVANVTAASTTITMNGNYSITANFAVILPGQYSLTISSTAGGSVTVPGQGTFAYGAGTVVNLTAAAVGGYRFVNWSGNVGTVANVTAASTTITMNSNYSITANFAVIPPVQYSLTISSTAGGSVTIPGQGTFTYNAGTLVNLVASPLGGYRFVNWTGNVGTIANITAASTTITMNGIYSITANFVPVYNLTMAVAPGGSGTSADLTGGSPYTAGTVVNIQAVATAGYTFANWSAPAGTFGSATAATTTFTMPTQSVTVTANFALIPPPPQYTLTIFSTAGGAVTTPGHGTFVYNAGTVVNLVATPISGYGFVDWTGNVGTTANVNAPSTTVTMNSNYSITANFERINFMVSGGDLHTVGLKSDGTVLAVGDNEHGQCNVSGWTNVIQVAAGGFHTVGLKSDGTVVATGNNRYGQCNVSGWTNVIQVAAGGFHTVGLKSDGTVVAMGYNYYGQCNVGAWTNIIQFTAGGLHTVGLKSDGTVVATGNNWYGQCDVSSWTNIIQVTARDVHTVGLKSNGTVVAAGYNYQGQCNVSGWTGIIQVTAGWQHTAGLRANGTVIAVGYNGAGQCNVGSWTNIVQVSAGWQHTVGLKSDGTMVAVGWNEYGQCNVGGWDLN
jgi:preprotein translocase subunit YajC